MNFGKVLGTFFFFYRTPPVAAFKIHNESVISNLLTQSNNLQKEIRIRRNLQRLETGLIIL